MARQTKGEYPLVPETVVDLRLPVPQKPLTASAVALPRVVLPAQYSSWQLRRKRPSSEPPNASWAWARREHTRSCSRLTRVTAVTSSGRLASITSMSAMSGERPSSPKTELAIANGTSVAGWARGNSVPERTAYRWSRELKVRAAVESCRRRAVDRAVGRMAKRITWATDGIAKLAKSADSESVKLAALRAILSDMMAVSKFAGLEHRVTKLEEQLNDQTGNTGFPG